jgi:hypothetical protein
MAVQPASERVCLTLCGRFILEGAAVAGEVAGGHAAASTGEGEHGCSLRLTSRHS